MADSSTDSTEEEVIEDENQEEVDEETQDETDDSDQDTDDTDAEETDDDESEEDDGDDDSDESDFTKRFTQFKGETQPEYLKNLEDGYAESSKEAVRLSRENKDLKAQAERINQLIATSPELAAAITGAEGQPVAAPPPKDPAILFAETQMKQTWQKEYDDFAREHPEIETDPALADALDSKLKVTKRIVEEEEGRLVGMGEGLAMAWKLLGRDAEDKQEKIRMASKDSASQGKASGGNKKEGKVRFTDAQISVHMDMANVDRSTAIKQLSEHVK